MKTNKFAAVLVLGVTASLASTVARADVKTDQAIAKAEEIIDGSFAPFTGPINNQAGDEVFADGQVATLEELLSMDYFVEGVIGDIPSS